MRQPRLKVPANQPFGYYHCISRVVDRRFIFGSLEKEHFVTLLREYEAFCHVKVLTFSIMSNHFHILLEVPKRPESLPSIDHILSNLDRLSGHHDTATLRQQLDLFRRLNDSEAESKLRDRFLARMWDVSAFMKLLKQRFTQWYNTRAGRKGTLWEERFKSVLVDGAGKALATLAAYIDLNSVRANSVEDPKDYRWSGYGAAMGGSKSAREGLRKVVAPWLGNEATWKEAAEAYRQFLYHEGREERETVLENGTTARGAFSRDAAQRVLAAKGRLSTADYVRCRVRYFCDGAIFGSREFVDGMFRAHRERFGPNRAGGARRMKGVEEEWYALRDLRVKVFD